MCVCVSLTRFVYQSINCPQAYVVLSHVNNDNYVDSEDNSRNTKRWIESCKEKRTYIHFDDDDDDDVDIC